MGDRCFGLGKRAGRPRPDGGYVPSWQGFFKLTTEHDLNREGREEREGRALEFALGTEFFKHEGTQMYTKGRAGILDWESWHGDPAPTEVFNH